MQIGAQDRLESDFKDECLAVYNGRGYDVISDNDLNQIIKRCLPKGVKLICIFDACHSASMLDLAFEFDPSSRKLVRTGYPELVSNGDVIALSGCRDDQVSMDTTDASGTPCGALTDAMLTILTPTISTVGLLNATLTQLKKNNKAQYPILSSNRNIDITKPLF